MVFFITFLRFLAACLITNSHYTGVYPTDIIANGGLLGDVLFFAVSGYCLANVKKSFPSWYWKRLVRCYLPVLIISGVYLLIGFYSLNENSALWWLLYPTNYHFVSSIIILYIPFYIIMKTKFLKKNLLYIMGIIALAYLIVYIAFYDKSYYHIDNVREQMIKFLFMEAMLIGAYFKINDEKFRNKFHWGMPILTVLSVGIYFLTKIIFSKKESISNFQIINQFTLIIALFFIFWLFCSIDKNLEHLPKWIKKIISFIADLTLEIYVVQFYFIEKFRNVAIFPINWFVITASIFVSAVLLHYICKFILYVSNLIINLVKDKIKNKETKES